MNAINSHATPFQRRNTGDYPFPPRGNIRAVGSEGGEGEREVATAVRQSIDRTRI